MKPTIAIIGGNGFIGKNFTSYFVAKGYQVTVLDSNIRKSDSNINPAYISTDIHHTIETVEAVNNVDVVIWLVHASVPATKDDSLVEDFTLNIAPIIKFLEKTDQLDKLKRFIYISSGGTVYGSYSESKPISEKTIHLPISNYGLSKSVAEKYIEFITRNKNFESVILRPSNVYGPFQNLLKPQGVVGFAFSSVKNGSVLDLYDGGNVIRDFVYVDDVADAVEKIIVTVPDLGKTQFYNVGSNEGISIKEILEKIEEISNGKLQLKHKASRKFDCAYNVLDTSKLQIEKRWSKKTPLEKGLQKVWEWIKNES